MTDLAPAPASAGADPAAALFHRQMVLLAAAVTVTGVGIITVMWLAGSAQPTPAVVRPLYYGGRRPVLSLHQPSTLSPWALWAAVAATGAAAVVLALSVVHAGRVAAFAFRRRGDS